MQQQQQKEVSQAIVKSSLFNPKQEQHINPLDLASVVLPSSYTTKALFDVKQAKEQAVRVLVDETKGDNIQEMTLLSNKTT